MPENGTQVRIDRWMRVLALLLVFAGIALRMFIYLQNRNLIIDEANVARNIYERSFAGLLTPLSYEQYAPPVFLWITKLNSLMFGMGEWALRIYPLLCGFAALVLMHRILKMLVPVSTLWYPLSLLVFAPVFIRYSSELKQYMPDVFFALLLIWLTLKNELNETIQRRFVLLWIVVGSVTVWSSMPGVFLLAGVGFYYGWQALVRKQYKNIFIITGITLVWVAQFATYYLLMLKEQANSGYLQRFHHYDFLFATPSKPEEWQHNWYVFSALMRQFEGLYPYAHDINTAFLVCGVIILARKNMALLLLFAGPVLAVCLAAALDQFSLMPRVSLFIIPVIILIIGYGFAQFAYLRSVWLRSVIILAGVYTAGCNLAQLTEKPFKYEQLTEGMIHMQQNNIPSPAISVYHSSIPAFLYYTTIHPHREKWESIKDADLLPWYTHYDSLGWQMRNVWSSRRPLGFLYTNCTEAEFKLRNDGIAKHLQLVDKIDKPFIKSYIYIKPLPQTMKMDDAAE